MDGPLGSGYPAEMSVECANDGSAWALRTGPDAAMSQDQHVGFHADQAGATAIFAEQYFQTQGTQPTAQSPGSDAGPFFGDRLRHRGLHRLVLGLRLRHRAVGHRRQVRRHPGQEGRTSARSPTRRRPASCPPRTGWVASTETVYPASGTGQSKSQERIVATTDGGRTWHVQYAGPWTAG